MPVENGPWGCLEKPEEPLPVPPVPPEDFAYIIGIVDFANPPTPPPGLEIKVCQINDFNCDNPLPVSITEPDPERPFVHQIILPYMFDGYLRLTAPGYIQNEYYFLAPILGSRDGGQVIVGDPIGMPRIDTMDYFFDQFGGAARNPDQGTVALRVFDCDETYPRTRAEGVRLELLTDNPTAIGFTILNGLPAANNPPFETDSRGVAGFGNLRPVSTIIRGMVDGEEFSRAAVTVRPNQLTQADLRYNDTYGI